MPSWNPDRSPDLYPAVWHEAVRAKPGKHFLQRIPAGGKRGATNAFSQFRACLRRYSQHPTAIALAKRTARLTFVEAVDGGWEVWLVTAWAIDITNMVG